MLRRARIVASAGVLLVLAACTTQPARNLAPAPMPATAACIEELDGRPAAGLRALDSRRIGVVNWNIRKGRDPGWVVDIAAMNVSPDLLILQEARHDTAGWQELVPGYFSSFAEGFGRDSSPSGVMTVSAAEPLTECEIVVHEPWFGTRKATLVTEYGLSDSDATLLVVNLHGINFTIGVRALRKQFTQARTVIDAHEGPVLLSGDFNTWRGQRVRALEQIVEALGLSALEYGVDHRKRFFGRPLDHIYVRGLHADFATTVKSRASDHNPMAVGLRVSEEPVHVKAAR